MSILQNFNRVKRIKEDRWFKLQQDLLLWLANSNSGRGLLCIPKDFPKIDLISKNELRGKISDDTWLSDFRVGAKWANVIRSRWQAFQEAASCYYRALNRYPIFYPVSPIPRYAYVDDTFYPDPNPETTSVDGYASKDDAQSSWSTLRAAVGVASSDIATTLFLAGFTDGSVSNTFYALRRNFTLFDTSSIPDSNNIDSATLSVYQSVASTLDNHSDSVALVEASLASNTAVANGDYEGNKNFNTKFATSKAHASWTNNTYNDFALNSNGLTNISKTGVSKFQFKSEFDLADSPTPTYVSSDTTSGVTVISADTAGTSTDPKLLVTHSVAGGVKLFNLMGVGN